MINKISIRNYKSIVDLDIELGRLNVFIGENGCGKTNILEAITCGSIVGDSGSILLTDTMMGMKGIRVTEPHLMSSAFHRPNNKTAANSTTNISFANKLNEFFDIGIFYPERDILSEGAAVIMSWVISDKTRHYVETELKENNSHFATKNKLNLNKVFGKNTVTSFLNYAPENYFLRRFEEEGQLKPLGIRGEGLFKHLVDIYKKEPSLLKEIGEKLRLIGWFQGFEIPDDLMFTERRINIRDKYLQELDFFDQRSANEGFLYLLFYFTLFMSPYTPNFFAIDNIDNALNPKLCAELTKQLAVLAKENNKQAILTTHNPAILDGLDLFDDEQRLFTIYRNADGHTIAKRIKAPKKVKGVESIRLSEAYIRGYLGGLPKNF